jgi:CP family cyanate transporter-like MFS transporter
VEKIQVSRASSVLIIASIVLVSLNLRPSMAAIGPLLFQIQEEISLSFTAASLLTMLPVLAMGAAMFAGIRVARVIGEHRAISLSLIMILIASAARLFSDNSYELIATAILAGLGIALVQAVMPAIIKSRFPSNVSLVMGFYVTAIMGGAALAATISPLVMETMGGWRMGLGIWAVLAVVSLFVWSTQKSVIWELNSSLNKVTRDRHLGNPRSWLLAVFFGIGTASYTCVLAWLAPYYVEKGWSEQSAGLILGFVTAMEVISGLATPAIANYSQDRRIVLIVLLLFIISGLVGLALIPETLSLLWPCLLGIGIGGLFPMSLIVAMDHIDNPMRAGGLAAFMQGIGYLIAGLSPLFAGLARDQLDSFEWAWLALAGAMFLLIGLAVRFNPKHYCSYYK